MHSRTVVITNEAGLHARPADLFVKTALRFDTEIAVIKENQRVDGKSILDLLMLAVTAGTEIRIEANGHDAEAALTALLDLVTHNFYEYDQQEPSP